MADFAGPLPLPVIAELLGVPVDQRADFCMWTNTMPVPGLGDLIAAKRRAPGPDLLSALITLLDDELTSLAFPAVVTKAWRTT